jgi:hypothetical protein
MDDLESRLRQWLGRSAAQAGFPDGHLAESFQVLDTG